MNKKSERINDLPATKANTHIQTYMHLKPCLESFVHIEHEQSFFLFFCSFFVIFFGTYHYISYYYVCVDDDKNDDVNDGGGDDDRKKTRHIKILFTCKHWNEEGKKYVYQVEPLTGLDILTSKAPELFYWHIIPTISIWHIRITPVTTAQKKRARTHTHKWTKTATAANSLLHNFNSVVKMPTIDDVQDFFLSHMSFDSSI